MKIIKLIIKSKKKQAYECGYCGDKFASKEERRIHDRDIHGFAPYKCAFVMKNLNMMNN